LPDRDLDSLQQEDILRFEGRRLYEVADAYTILDVNILYRSLLEIEKLYNSIEYSMTDKYRCGIASISYDHSLRIRKGQSSGSSILSYMMNGRIVYLEGHVRLMI
jgi:hypothetical protein